MDEHKCARKQCKGNREKNFKPKITHNVLSKRKIKEPSEKTSMQPDKTK